jgi:mRNA m6A methyltransferase non-catalytic subunit
MKELMMYKNCINEGRSHPPMYTTLDYKRCSLTQFGKFDTIWVNAPLQEYVDRVKPFTDFKLHEKINKEIKPWNYEELKALPIKELADSQCFLFFWVGSGEYLELGRELFKHWGFRRCEEIVWLKTTLQSEEDSVQTNEQVIYDDPERIFKRMKEH